MDIIDKYSEYDKAMLTSAYNTITNLDKWDFIKDYEPPQNCGFLFDNNNDIISIMNEINNDYPYHSGSSLACTMRIMKEIAKNVK